MPVAAQKTTPTELSEETLECNECHAAQTAAIYQEWGASKHFRANVGCFECHRADPADADAFDHMGNTISIIVSPRDCAGCHEKEVREFDESHHAKAGLILGSLDNFLADVVEGDKNFYGGSPTAPTRASSTSIGRSGCWARTTPRRRPAPPATCRRCAPPTASWCR